MGGGNAAVNVGSGSGVQLVSSQGNLTFGWGDNGIWPAPVSSSSDDTSGAATPSSVFVDPMNGDFHLKPGGTGAGTGQNVYGAAPYGSVTTDRMQAPRPMSGPWDRGAYGM